VVLAALFPPERARGAAPPPPLLASLRCAPCRRWSVLARCRLVGESQGSATAPLVRSGVWVVFRAGGGGGEAGTTILAFHMGWGDWDMATAWQCAKPRGNSNGGGKGAGARRAQQVCRSALGGCGMHAVEWENVAVCVGCVLCALTRRFFDPSCCCCDNQSPHLLVLLQLAVLVYRAVYQPPSHHPVNHHTPSTLTSHVFRGEQGRVGGPHHGPCRGGRR